MCDYCHKPNHTEENCNAKKRAQGGFGGKGQGGKGEGCHICGSKDHWRRECPDRDRKKGATNTVRGGKAGRGGG